MQKISTTKYGYSIQLPGAFSQAVEAVKGAFAVEGFGVLSEINMKEKMKEKLGKEMDEYVILGMCNPTLAFQALESEQEIGLMLPCNVIVYRNGDETIVSAQQPKLMLGVTGNAALEDAADEADKHIVKVLEVLLDDK
ncbi:MAG: DUF302 domain-containing protein [Candidatus Moranbacteria bacterium]|nr:DUF302 domain-containing protein [Candidatus Moranbacteria bacterium]